MRVRHVNDVFVKLRVGQQRIQLSNASVEVINGLRFYFVGMKLYSGGDLINAGGYCLFVDKVVPLLGVCHSWVFIKLVDDVLPRDGGGG